MVYIKYIRPNPDLTHQQHLIRSTTSQLLRSTRLLSQTGWVYHLHGRCFQGVHLSRSPVPSVCWRQAALLITLVYDVLTSCATLQICILEIDDWHSCRLQLNETNEKLIWFGTMKMLGKVPESELNLTVSSNTIQPVTSVHNPGIPLDTELSMKTQLCHLRQIRHLVGQEVTAQLVSMFILSQLEYCNSLLAGLRDVPLNHCAACSECSSSICSHPTPAWSRNSSTAEVAPV